MERRRFEETDEEALKVLRRGWCLGSEAFRREMLQKTEGKLRENHVGTLRLETSESRADNIIPEELRKLGWSQSDLATRRKNVPGKLEIAAWLRKETILTIKSIAAKVYLGTSKSGNARLHKLMRAEPPAATHHPQLGI